MARIDSVAKCVWPMMSNYLSSSLEKMLAADVATFLFPYFLIKCFMVFEIMKIKNSCVNLCTILGRGFGDCDLVFSKV